MVSSSVEDSGETGFTAEPVTRQSLFGFGTVRTWASLKWMEILFLVATSISLIITISLCIVKLVEINDNPNIDNNKDVDFTFAIILIINSLFCMYYVFHGVLWERAYEVSIYIGAVIVVTIYLSMNYIQTIGDITFNVKLVRLIAAVVLGPTTAFIGVKLAYDYNESGNLIFRTVGATEELQNACKMVFATEGLLKFDLQLVCTMLILIMRGPTFHDEQILTLAIGVPFSFIWAFGGYLVIRFENVFGCIAFFALGFLEPAYVIYLMVTSAQLMSSGGTVVPNVTFACGALSLLLRILLFIGLGLCGRNFGKGLKEKIAPTFCRGRTVMNSRTHLVS